MDLITYLRWQTRADEDRYSAAFEAASERRLSEALSVAGTCRPGIADDLRRAVENLPAGAVLRVARAPELEYKLRGARLSSEGAGELVRFLCQAIRAELLRTTNDASGSDASEAWTALGDCRFAPANEVGAGIGGWTSEWAPTVGEIPIDFASPHCRGDVARRFATSWNYARDQRHAVVRQIRDGMTIVRSAGPEVTRFVEAFTRVVVPLAVEDEQGRVGSFSSSWYPGRSVLVNVHGSEMTLTDLAAALVHEAIHSLIDVSELAGKLLAADDGENPSVTSPWTGNVISLQSLLDAYFVWFGLRGFWTRVLDTGGVRPELCEWWLDECSRGFHPPFQEVIGEELIPLVHPRCLAMIESVRETARSESYPTSRTGATTLAR